MSKYFIEIRHFGKTKTDIKSIIFDVSKKFRVRGMTRKRPVPHITLFGPFRTNKRKLMIEKFIETCKKFEDNNLEYSLEGLDHFRGGKKWLIFNQKGKVIFIKINASKSLKEFRVQLSKELGKFCYGTEHDLKKEFEFHSTLAFKDIDKKFDKIWTYLKTKRIPKKKQKVLRITLLNEKREIVYEYDMILKKLLNRKRAKSRYWIKKTFNQLTLKS